MQMVANYPPKSGSFSFTRDQYFQMAELGYFEGRRVELIGGEIVEMPAQSHKHYGTMDEVREVLTALFGPGYWVRMEGTLDLSPCGVPDPDISVVLGERRTHTCIPTSALLIVEISDSRLTYDRTTKASLYAASGIQDYWILNVKDRQLEIRRDPQPDIIADFGFSYGSLRTYKPGASVTPLALPNTSLPVDRLFL